MLKIVFAETEEIFFKTITCPNQEALQEWPIRTGKELTIFPDQTSQIWRLPEEIFKCSHDTIKIIWEFENETEIIQLLQLALLLSFKRVNTTDLYIPYLPYGRQDKLIKNDATFALHAFLDILCKSNLFRIIYTLDAHNIKIIEGRITSLPVINFIKYAIDKCQPRLICFPDEGASKRGYNIFGKPYFCLSKKRNQQTGDIIGMELESDLYNLKDKDILLVDDICDGGRTFISAAEILYNEGAKNVYLYVTHGIFSKGIKVLFDAGIKRIFTRKGEHCVESSSTGGEKL